MFAGLKKARGLPDAQKFRPATFRELRRSRVPARPITYGSGRAYYRRAAVGQVKVSPIRGLSRGVPANWQTLRVIAGERAFAERCGAISGGWRAIRVMLRREGLL